MTERLVVFAHGKESGPWGLKITALAAIARERGYAVDSPDYSFTFDPDQRVRHLLARRPTAEQLVLVGSSMGGYVSALASRELAPRGLFLIAPAFYMPGYAAEPEPRADAITVVHGWDDEIIPVAHALRFAERHRATLHLLDGDHALNARIASLERLFGLFLDQL